MNAANPATPQASAAMLQATLPVASRAYRMPVRTGLIIVDEIDGFCTPGCGPLAPPAPDARIGAMVEATDGLARRFVAGGLPVLAFLDTHVPGRAEPPYPPHCEAGTGHEELVAALRWLEGEPGATLMRKDCINGVVGGIEDMAGTNRVFEWIRGHGLQAVVFTGICTDICVADAVLTLLSARNHHIGDQPMLGALRDVVVYEPACATYDLPLETARTLGLPDTAAHPAAQAHHMGLWIMQARGAVLADRLD